MIADYTAIITFVLKQNKPTAEALQAAVNKKLPDMIAPGLKAIFCGINPSLYSAALGFHFARPGNRFWPALFAGGVTPKLLQPWQQGQLLEGGWGITNVVDRPTTAAAELALTEIREGALKLREKVLLHQPAVLAVLGLQVFRAAFEVKEAAVGLQNETIGSTRLWVLPNPSGLNAHYTPRRLGELFAELRIFVEKQA